MLIRVVCMTVKIQEVSCVGSKQNILIQLAILPLLY